MPILQLYSADSRGVVQSRICPLPDCSSAVVRKEINGEYSLTFTAPAGSMYEDEILLGRAVKARVSESGTDQFFIIKRRTRTLLGEWNVYAEHQSYYYNGVLLRGTSGGSRTASLAVYQLSTAAIPSISGLGTITKSITGNPSVITDAISSPTPLRRLLFDWLVRAFGGELVFDGFNVTWVDAVGADNGAAYRYGVNLTEMESEEILDDYASGIMPYWGSIDPKTNVGIVTIEGNVLNFPGAWPMEVIVPVNLTSKFENQPTAAQLLAAAQDYVAKNAPSGVPLSIRASRARIDGDVPVDLGDTVRVVNTPWGLDTKTRIQALTFDALQGRVIDVQLGNINPGFAGAVQRMK